MLTEQYKKLGKYDPKRQSLSDELNRAKAALGEQKYALGELQSQQALARLSTKALRMNTLCSRMKARLLLPLMKV